MAEKRKYIRFDTSVNVEYMVPGNNILIEGISSTKNLSREGMQLALNGRLAAGTELEFKLQIPGDAAPIYAKGTIIWSQRAQKEGEPIAGIKFIEITPFDRNRILDHVYKEWVEKRFGKRNPN